MAAVEDVLRTRLELAGIQEYAHGIGQVARSLFTLNRELGETEKAQLAVGIATGAVALALGEGLLKAGEKAGESQAIIQRAALSFQQFGHNLPEGALEAFGNRIQDTTAIARDQAIAIAGLFGEFGQGEKQAEQLTTGILNAAEALKARGVSAESLASRIGIALERARAGEPNAFGRLAMMGIIVDKAKAAIDPFGAVMDALTRKGGKQAEMFRLTLPGAVDAFRNSLARLGQDVGSYVVPPLTATLQVLTRILDVIDKMPGGPALVAGATGAVALGSAIRSASSIIAVAGAVRGLGTAALAAGAAHTAGGGVAAAAGGRAGFIAQLMKADPSMSAARAAQLAAVAGYPAAAGLGARALGFLKGPAGLGLGAVGAFGISEASRGNQGVLGQLGFIGGRAAAGALGGAALTGGNPWGIAIGGALGAIEAVYERMSQRGETQQKAADATDSLTKSNEDLRAAINNLNQKLDQFVGNSDIRDVLGDSRLVAAFARGIA